MRGILRLEIPSDQRVSINITMNVSQARELKEQIKDSGLYNQYPMSDFHSLLRDILDKMIIVVDELASENGVPVL